MIAVDPPVRILNEALESKGPSTQDTKAEKEPLEYKKISDAPK